MGQAPYSPVSYFLIWEEDQETIQTGMTFYFHKTVCEVQTLILYNNKGEQVKTLLPQGHVEKRAFLLLARRPLQLPSTQHMDMEMENRLSSIFTIVYNWNLMKLATFRVCLINMVVEQVKKIRLVVTDLSGNHFQAFRGPAWKQWTGDGQESGNN